MRRVLFLWLIALVGFVQAERLEVNSALAIYTRLFEVLTNKTHFRIYTPNAELQRVFGYSDRIALLEVPDGADVAIVSNDEEMQKLRKALRQKAMESKLLIVTRSYHHFINAPDLVGAFYWSHGRKQFLFREQILKRFGIVLPDEFRRYIVDDM